jgi:hypothetical protein
MNNAPRIAIPTKMISAINPAFHWHSLETGRLFSAPVLFDSVGVMVD